jgi:tight adherence protein B
MSITLIIMIAVFLGVVALVGGVATLWMARQASSAEERLDALTQSAGSASAASSEAAGILMSPLDEDSPLRQLEQVVLRYVNLRALITQAGVKVSPAQVVLFSLGLAVGGGLICSVTAAPLVAVPIGVVTCGSLPLLWLLVKRHRRLGKFDSQMPDAMDLLARSLRAGYSLADGVRLIGEELADPINGEFTRCYEQQNLGVSLEEALQEMADRVPSLDLQFFVTAVILQRQTGGDTAEILEKIGRLVRQRFQIRGQIKALTGEGRLSGIVLLALPVFLGIYMYFRNPEYLMVLFRDPIGHQMIAGAVILQIIGALVIKKIVNIKV